MACSFMWVYTVYLALCIHLMNAKRVELVDSNDGLFCECKTAESQSECASSRKFYHPQVKKCCRMSKKKEGFGKMFHKASFWKSKYVRQNTKDLCLEEELEFKERACCTVADSAKFFGQSMRVSLSKAKVYSMAHPKMNSEPKEEDYMKKSKIVIEMDAVSSGYYLHDDLPANKIIEGLKQLQQKDQLLQCEENFNEVRQGGGCHVLEQPVCCCTQKALDRKVAEKIGADSPLCLMEDCAPDTDRVYLKGELERKGTFGRGYLMSKRVDWDGFAPFSKCPASFRAKDLHFVKKTLYEQLTGHEYGKCVKAKSVNYLDDSTVPPHVRERTWCIEKYYTKVCPAGKVLYNAFRGHTLKDAVLCPSRYKSNLPGDRNFDSKCDCGDGKEVHDSLSRWEHGTGEVKGRRDYSWIGE